MKAKDKLKVTYNKRQKDFLFQFPTGLQTVCDARYMNNVVFTKEVTDELERRGYDIATLKFSIEPMLGAQKFESQRNDELDVPSN